MVKVSHSVSFVTTASPARCISLARRLLSDNGTGGRHGIDQEIEGYPGSAFQTRLFDGWLESSAKLPMWVRIYCQPAPNGVTSVILVLEEALAQEVVDQRLADCYQRAFRELADGLESILSGEPGERRKRYIPAQAAVESLTARA